MRLIKDNYNLDPRLHGDDRKERKNNILLFFLINLLGTPAFYTQQLFIVYMLVLGCVAVAKFLDPRLRGDDGKECGDDGKRRGNDIKRIFFAFLLILIINSFWILPQVYFLKTNGGWISQAKSNQIATEDTLYQNLEKGTLNNFLKLEGFYFDLRGLHGTPLFEPWKDHFQGVLGLLPYAFAGLMLIGLAKSLTSAVRRKQNQEQTAEVFANLGFVLIFVLCATTLLLATPPFSWINELIRQIPIINQIFRSPFTKFIIPYSLVYCYFVAKGVQALDSRLRGNDKVPRLFLVTCFLVIILYSLPAFQGYFISTEMKVTIPSDYSQVMDYFKTADKNKRIALLPDYTFWGWFFNKWGYNGSGLLWYGIEQPIVSRTFDVWSPKSESYFWEEKQALEAENLPQFEKVLDKYNVDYLIMDDSLIPVVSSYKSLATDRIESLISSSQKISLVFRGENIALYQVNHRQKIEGFVTLSSGLKNIGPEVRLLAEDQAYQEKGDYVLDSRLRGNDNVDFDFYYPFADLTTQTRIKDKHWNIKELINSFSINSDVGLDLSNYQFSMPLTSTASISNDQGITDLKLNLNPFYEDKKIKINFEKLPVKSFNVSGFNNKTEFALTAPELPQKYGYLIKIRSKNIKGSPLFFYIVDQTKKQSMLEEKLRADTEYFILPHKFDYGLGYSFVFQNKSYKNYPSENLLEEVSVYLFPYEELKSAKFIKNNLTQTIPGFSNNFQAKKINYFTYTINPSTSLRTNNLILYQSYDPGWIAFANGKHLDHVLVNNWANGWKIDDQTNDITIIFWPQYLEFLGFALLAIAFLSILLVKKKYD